MTMIDEGIYLFFDNECCDQGGRASLFYVIELSNKFLQDIKRLFLRSELNRNESDEQEVEFQSLSKRKFQQCFKRITTVRFVPVKSFLELELALGESSEFVDCFHKIISGKGFMFAMENFDSSFFVTGTSTTRWFNSRFPLSSKKIKYAKPPSMLDLLYEYLEIAPNSQEDFLTLKEMLLTLSKEDRLFVENMLSGKKLRETKKNQEIGARILRALREGKV